MKENQKPLSFFDVLAFAARYWRRQPVKLCFFTCLFVATALVETLLPEALSNFLKALRLQEALPTILTSLYLFIGLSFLPFLIRFVAILAYNRFETQLFKDLMADAFSHVHRLSEQFFADNFAGAVISRITRGRTQIERFEDHIFHRLLPTSVVLIASLVLLSGHFPLLAILLGFYIAFMLGISMVLVMRIAGPAQLAYASALDMNVARIADNISGIATTKAYAQEEEEVLNFSDMLEIVRVKNHKTYFCGNVISFTQNTLVIGMLSILLGGGVWYFVHGKADVEDLAYLSLAYTIMQSYLREISFQVKDLITSSYDLHGLISLMNEKPMIQDQPSAKDMTVTDGAIEFKNITFTYPSGRSPVFENFSLSIRAGEKVALVGKSGSGKTTFLRLLQRAYDVQEGSITIDGQDIKKHTQKSLRKNMALVPQDPVLFHRSLKDNIAYAKPEASLHEIFHAAEQAHIDLFIQGLPEKYDTLVGERGIKLSGGERQRIAIARAILSDRPILLLDEATSSLDSSSEKAIQSALQELIQGRTSVLIAHRLSTILDADRILVFDKGKIVEEGTHKELLAQQGLYAHFYELQSGGFIVEDLEED
jgi:ATP-binding cassette subfamily B protein